MGAWIETVSPMRCFVNVPSHPLWVRGLKLLGNQQQRSIKHVASFMGAWIETFVHRHVW